MRQLPAHGASASSSLSRTRRDQPITPSGSPRASPAGPPQASGSRAPSGPRWLSSTHYRGEPLRPSMCPLYWPTCTASYPSQRLRADCAAVRSATATATVRIPTLRRTRALRDAKAPENLGGLQLLELSAARGRRYRAVSKVSNKYSNSRQEGPAGHSSAALPPPERARINAQHPRGGLAGEASHDPGINQLLPKGVSRREGEVSEVTDYLRNEPESGRSSAGFPGVHGHWANAQRGGNVPLAKPKIQAALPQMISYGCKDLRAGTRQGPRAF